MCGIAGVAGGGPRPATDRRGRMEEVSHMLSALAHRGPDGEGIEALDGVVLGHRRLAVIDLSERARQPMTIDCRAAGSAAPWIVFNGEIYNHVELRRELAGRGHRFGSDSDTEVILHLYEERGEECVEPLRGMFAFALWDPCTRGLLLARDRLGKKPLYYREKDGELAFASEIKALVGLARRRGEPVEPDDASLRSYLALKYVPGPRTAVKGIRSLPAGCVLEFRAGTSRVRSWWTLPAAVPEAEQAAAGGSPDEAALRDALEGALREAVKIRLRSDVPLGIFLSGGLDSAILAAVVTRLIGKGEAPSGLRAFTVGFDEKDYDELAHASELARVLGAHHEPIALRPTVADTIDILPSLAWQLDQPLADSSALATSHLARAVRRHVTVALSGDGADELFLGYDRYRAHGLAHRLESLVPRPVRRGAARHGARAVRLLVPAAPGRRNLAGRARRFLEAMALDPLARNDLWITCIGGGLARQVLTSDFLGTCDDPLEAIHRAVAPRDPGGSLDALIRGAQRADLLVYLADDILRKADLATMAHSLEARSPWLDQEVVAAAMKIPVSMKIRGGQGKAILRDLFAPALPAGTTARRKKGFGMPLDHWLRGDLSRHCRDVLLDRRTLDRGMLRADGVAALIDAHVSGRANHEDPLWALLMMEHWFRSCLDGSQAAAPRRETGHAALVARGRP